MRVLPEAKFRRLVAAVRQNSGLLHVEGSDRHKVIAALRIGAIPSDATVTFHDDDDKDERGRSALCLGIIENSRVTITHKTYPDPPAGPDPLKEP